jgi:nucleotide-binding universal stress UspA family protein
MFKKILCPTDGSDHAYKALDLAIDMAKKYDAEPPLVNSEIDRLRTMDYRISVATDSAFQDSAVSPRLLIEVGHHIVGRAKGRAERSGLENVDALLEVGDPADRILKCIDRENIDCVIMGSRGLNDFKGLFLGSVSHKVANRAPCTCIAVK